MRAILASAILSMLLTCVAFEGALRIFGPFLPGSYRTGPMIEPDAELGWRHIPDATTWFRQPEFISRVEANAQGRLGAPVPAERPPTRRIVVMGDSFVAAGQMPYESTMTALLPSMMPGTLPVEVINEGVSGYGTDQAVIALERRVAALGPDDVVLVFTVANDVWNNDWDLEGTAPTYQKPHFTLERDELVLRPVVETERPLIERIRVVFGRSWLFTAIKTGVLDPLAGKALPEARERQLEVLKEPNGVWTRAWEITTRLIVRFADRARRMGARPFLVIAPDPCQVYEDSCGGRTELMRSSVPQDMLRRAALEADLPVLDLLPEFRARAAEGDRLYFARDLHWTASGQRLAAEMVGSLLEGSIRSSSSSGR